MSKNTRIALGAAVLVVLGLGTVLTLRPASTPTLSKEMVEAETMAATTEPAASAETPTAETAPAPVTTTEEKPAETTAEAPVEAPAVTEEKPTEDVAAPAVTPEAAPATVAADPQQLDIAALMEDRVLGESTAPVTIVEYASFTCSHCAHFHKEIYPLLKKDYIDTGKVKMIFREFPLDGTALKAGQMVRCAAKEKYFNLVETIFANQERWIATPDPMAALAQFGKLAGITDEMFKACTENKDLADALSKNMQGAQTMWKVSSTPTFILNDGKATIIGARDYKEYQTAIDNIIAEQGH